MTFLFNVLKFKSYILPLHKKSGGTQLFILIALMTSLAVIITSIHFSLFRTVGEWRRVIEYQASIEIPALKDDGTSTAPLQRDKQQKRILDFLKNTEAVSQVDVMAEKDVMALITPWLGSGDHLLGEIGLPTVINFKLKTYEEDAVAQLKSSVEKIAPRARLQTHQTWLDKFLSIIRGVHLIGIVILTITLSATIFVISSTVKSRMQIFKEELSLLHIMGAHDIFIIKQFFTYLLGVTLPACLTGYLAACAVISLTSVTLLKSDIAFLPSFTLNASQFLLLLVIPFVICIIAFSIGTKTVLQEMRKMP